MAFPLRALLLSCLLSAASAEEISMTFSPVQHLVDYSYASNMSSLLPGLRYDNSITAVWAVEDSALQGLEGRAITVKVTAEALNSSSIRFISQSGMGQESSEGYLQCAVQNGTCSNSSNLALRLPFTVMLQEGENSSAMILLSAKIVPQQEGAIDTSGFGQSASDIFNSLKNALGQGNGSNSSQNSSSHNSSLQAEGENFLDSLKPEGDSGDPLEFLRENPLISLGALAIVIVITGAYLINTKD